MIKRIINWLSYEPEIKPNYPSAERITEIIDSLTSSQKYSKTFKFDDGGASVVVNWESLDLVLREVHLKGKSLLLSGTVRTVEYKGVQVFRSITAIFSGEPFYEKGQWAIDLEHYYKELINGNLD